MLRYFFVLSIVALLVSPRYCPAQTVLPDSCKLEFGTNLTGLFDWTTELPFVDLMKIARSWGTQNSVWVMGGTNPFNTNVIDYIPKNAQGYPLQVPFFQAGLGLETTQIVYTLWVDNEAWPAGIYVFLYDGEGTFEFVGDAVITATTPGRLEVQVTPAVYDIIILKILSTNPANPARNFRFLMPGHEFTYATNPFNPAWLDKVAPFTTLRFMDWGHTNNWGVDYMWENFDEATDSIRVPWSQRAAYDYYTWTTNKGAPYEIMIQACNQLNKNMWICVPHNASDDYITQLATMVRDQLNPNLKVYVEYSNEIWNWMFGQTHWLNEFGCVAQNQFWPEGIVPYIQNCMDIWTSVFAGQMHRLVRVVGVQASWQDVSNRIVFNLSPGSFDAFSPAGYFGLTEAGDQVLDALGSAATVDHIVPYIIDAMEETMVWLRSQKTSIGDSLNIPMLFYEGGQHVTAHPFGVTPTYAQALTDLQRDDAMYDLYMAWFDSVRQLQNGSQPLLFMHFSLAAPLSAQYGSWGMVEYINQDTSLIPAPKYRALLNSIHPGCQSCPASCTTPTGLNTTKITATSAKLNWQSAQCAIKYNLRYRPLGSTTWQNASAKADKTGKKIKNLLPATQYEWQIRSRCSESPLITSAYSASQLFTTLPLRENSDLSQPAFRIYPNPATEALFVSGPLTGQEFFEVYDLHGRRLQAGLLSHAVAVADLPAGMFILRIQTAESVQQFIFVKN